MAKPPPEPRLGGFKIQGPVRGAPSAKNNDRLWRCTNDEARGTVFVKWGAAPRSASTWPVPASASAVERPWSCTLPPELGLTVCGYLDAPSLARLEISRCLGDQASRAWEAQAADLDRGDLGDDVSAKRLVMLHVRTMYAFENRTHGHIPNFDEFAFSARVFWGPLDRRGRRGATTTAIFHNMQLRTRRLWSPLWRGTSADGEIDLLRSHLRGPR